MYKVRSTLLRSRRVACKFYFPVVGEVSCVKHSVTGSLVCNKCIYLVMLGSHMDGGGVENNLSLQSESIAVPPAATGARLHSRNRPKLKKTISLAVQLFRLPARYALLQQFGPGSRIHYSKTLHTSVSANYCSTCTHIEHNQKLKIKS